MTTIKISTKALQRAAVTALSLVALVGSAWAYVEVFVPWAPRETIVIATDNSIARLTSHLVTLQSLLRTTQATAEQNFLRLEIERIRREIQRFEEKQKKYLK